MLPIKKIILHRIKLSLQEPFVNSLTVVSDKEMFIVEAIDTNGNSGFGESVAFDAPWYTEETIATTKYMMEQFLIPILKENNFSHPDKVTMLFQTVKRNNMAKAAIEGAIWDLYAKQEEISLSTALGGTRKYIEVGISLGIENNITTLLKKIANYTNLGYRRVKVKIKPGADITVIQNIRKQFPNLPLMVDANSAYSLTDLDHLRQFDKFNLLMIEQPLADDDIVEHATLQAALKTPICLDESIHSLADVKQAVALKSCKIINVKPGRVGGLTEVKKIHDYCEKHQIELWCGGMLEAGIGRAHNIAVASLANFTLPGDIGASSRYFNKDIIQPEVIVNDGKINVPTSSGIGYELDREYLEECTLEKMEYIL